MSNRDDLQTLAVAIDLSGIDYSPEEEDEGDEEEDDEEEDEGGEGESQV